MKKVILFILLIFVSNSCKNEVNRNKKIPVKKNENETIYLIDTVKRNIGIRFDFKKQKNTEKKSEIIQHLMHCTMIDFYIYNDNNYPIYFQSTSCYGEIDLLVFDKNILTNNQSINCVINNPIIISIMPHDYYRFNAFFQILKRNRKINFGFDFVRCNKNDNAENILKFKNPAIKNIIWSGLKNLQ
jgi:hypothetical protein